MKITFRTAFRTFFLLINLAVGWYGTSFAVTMPKTISFATEATYPPFEIVAPSGQLQGFDIDVANAICANLKVQCIFINQPFDSLIPNLNMGKFDAIIAAMNITPERAKSVAFTKAYYKNSGSFVTQIKQNFAINAKGLKGKTIGVQQGTTFQQYLAKTYGNGVIVKTYPSMQQAFSDLAAGRVDVVMGDTPIVQQWMVEHGEGKYHFIGQAVSDIAFFGAGYGIAIKKGNTNMLNWFNKAILGMEKDGTLAKIEAKYFPK